MKKSLLHLMLTAIILSIAGMKTNAQPGSSRPSPKMGVTGKIGDADITITYGSPAVKGRKIWGNLVPYDTVWRAGANEATVIETNKDIVLQGNKLAAGKYSLYTIPGEKNWRVIINSQTGQWGIKRTGETTRDPAKDVIIVTVVPRKSLTFEERLTYEINAEAIVLKWENLEIPLLVKL